MAKPTSPHTQSQQNTNFAQTDVNPDDMPQTVGTGEDAATYENRDGAHTGGTRSPKHTPGSANPHNTAQQVAHDASKQGISNRSAESEAGRQEKVVSQRQDSQAGVNHSGKTQR
jgi:hypothetical protein